MSATTVTAQLRFQNNLQTLFYYFPVSNSGKADCFVVALQHLVTQEIIEFKLNCFSGFPEHCS